jgi:hypothetical protein
MSSADRFFDSGSIESDAGAQAARRAADTLRQGGAMYPRSQDDDMARDGRLRAAQFHPVRRESQSERMREIRRRVADDAYRSEAVVDEIARRILMSREL